MALPKSIVIFFGISEDIAHNYIRSYIQLLEKQKKFPLAQKRDKKELSDYCEKIQNDTNVSKLLILAYET